MNVIRVGGIWGNHQAGAIYSTKELCPTIVCNGGGGHIPFIVKYE